MKKNKGAISLVMALLLALSLLSGCGQFPTTAPEASSSTPQQVVAAEREITDMAGRTMTVPSEIKSVFSTNPVSAIYLYTLVPEKLLGWNYELNDIEKSIILEKYHSLPSFGMGDAINYEAVIAAGPTIAFNVGAINEGSISDSDKLAESLGIPVVMVSGDLLAAPEVYRFMGDLFGAEEQAEQLVLYAEDTFQDIAGMNIPEADKVRIYYGNGEDSLETAPAGSAHGQLIELVNGINAADLELGDGARIQISAEQLLKWDPDVIVLNGEPKANLSGGSAAEEFRNNPDFATLKAVQEGKVYGAPNAPFSWVDRPPGPNRIVGMRWLSGLIYPEYLDYDVDEEVGEFFRLFYHMDLTEAQLTNLYNGIL